MDTDLLNDILNCPSLPSIPAVAAKVIELTADPDVEMSELASQITIDQALASKVLRTVNSSFYGLRKRCTTIEKALIFLGLSPVKSLVLGFSLVSAFSDDESEDFDYKGYWTRGLHSAVAAKLIADEVKLKDHADECFLTGLLQDIGMIAMFRAMKTRYIDVVNQATDDHTKLARLELQEFDLQHATVGATLAEHWRLPLEIVVPLKYHERPTACPTEYARSARCVALANLIHNVLIADNPTEPLRQVYERAHSWLGIRESRIDEIIEETGHAARQFASVLEVELDDIDAPEEILARAERQHIDLTREDLAGSYAANEVIAESGSNTRDPLTGVLNRDGFKHAIGQVYSAVKPGEVDITVVQAVISGLATIAQKHGPQVRENIIIGVANLMVREFEPLGGAVCRLSAEAFGIVLPEIDSRTAQQTADVCKESFAKSINAWVPGAPNLTPDVRIHIGLATLDKETALILVSPEKLVLASSRAVQTARSSQASAVHAFNPGQQAA
jgi:HD-like signal output (HDOD) protein/class 3 adenylate cyclase